MSQEAPVLILKQKDIKYQLGGAANVARNIKQLGAQVMVSGAVGYDQHNKMLHHLFHKEGIHTEGLITSPYRPTTIKTRIVAQERQLIRYDNEDKTDIDPNEENVEIMRIKKFNPDLLVIADYDKGNVTKSMMQKLLDLHKPIYVNGKPEHINIYQGITCLVCNDYEYTHSLKEGQTDNLCQYLQCNAIVHTLGHRGLEVVTSKETHYVAPYVVQEVDPTGASDTIISVVALEDQVTDVFKAAKMANKAASIVVTKAGTHCITYKDLEKEVLSLFSTNEKE